MYDTRITSCCCPADTLCPGFVIAKTRNLNARTAEAADSSKSRSTRSLFLSLLQFRLCFSSVSGPSLSLYTSQAGLARSSSYSSLPPTSIQCKLKTRRIQNCDHTMLTVYSV